MTQFAGSAHRARVEKILKKNLPYMSPSEAGKPLAALVTARPSLPADQDWIDKLLARKARSIPYMGANSTRYSTPPAHTKKSRRASRSTSAR